MERIIRFAAEPEDSEELRLRKLIGVAVIASSTGTYLLYCGIYILFGEHSSAWVTIEGAAVSVALLIAYAFMRRYWLLWSAYMSALTFNLAAIHLLLGGFQHSGLLVVWLLAVPMMTMVAASPFRGLVSAIVVAFVVAGVATLDGHFSRPNQLPPGFLPFFSALNLLGTAAYIILTVFFYVWRLNVISRLVVEEREARVRQAEQNSRQKSEFLANMSHELRTPLNGIIGFSEVLTERMLGELNEKQEEYARDIHASGQHLLSLINDILDLSKVEAGRMELELTDFDLPLAIDIALTLVRERAGRRGITLHSAVDGAVGQIRGDERKMKQILLNLLSNALKFTPEGGRIDVRAVSVDGAVEISVKDTGIGIAPEDQAVVFEEFRQVGKAEKKAEGTGLGLSLCRKFVELHGGRIWVTSQPGQGSTLAFTIPVQRGE